MTNSAGPEFVLGGVRYNTSISSQDSYGGYWSSVAYSSAIYTYRLDLNISGSVNPVDRSLKYGAFSLRCLVE